MRIWLFESICVSYESKFKANSMHVFAEIFKLLNFQLRISPLTCCDTIVGLELVGPLSYYLAGDYGSNKAL